MGFAEMSIDEKELDDAPSEHPLDVKLIAALREDGRLTNMALSRRFGVSEASVRQRLKRLYETRAVRSCVAVDFRAMGLHHMALVRFRVAPGSAERIAERAAGLREFPYVARSTGTHAIVAFTIAEDAKALGDLLDREFRGDADVHNIDVETVTSTAGFDSSMAFL